MLGEQIDHSSLQTRQKPPGARSRVGFRAEHKIAVD